MDSTRRRGGSAAPSAPIASACRGGCGRSAPGLVPCASRFREPKDREGDRLAGFDIRLAERSDRADIERLIARSARELCSADYSGAQIEAALGNAFGVDSQLIDDRTYFVVEQGQELAGAGGWSFRRTLFGADARPDRTPEALDPALEPAKIRAFFVAPEHARQGIGRALLERCEQAARSHGFRLAELAATLTGERLYSAMGYQPVRRFSHALGGGVLIDFISMQKPLA